MIIPPFKPFMYTQAIYKFTGKGPDSSHASVTSSASVDTASVSPDVAHEKIKLQDSLRDYSNAIVDSTKHLKEKLKYKNEQVSREIREVSKLLRQQVSSYKNEINRCKTKDAAEKLKQKMRQKFLQLNEKVKSIEKADANKKKLINALEKQVGEVRSLYKQQYKEKLIDNENIEEKHFDMLLDAYLMRIYLKNAEAIKKMGSEGVNVFALTLQDGKYVDGPIVDDINNARSYIDKAIGLWEQDKPRSVYKNKEWDTEYEDTIHGAPARVASRNLLKPTEKQERKIQNRNEQGTTPLMGTMKTLINITSDELKAQYAQTIEGMLPPLPDWGEGQEKTKHTYESSLEGAEGKQYVEKLKDKMRFLHAAQALREKLVAAGVDVSTVKLMPDKKSARLFVKKNGKRLGYITVLTNGKVNFSNTGGTKTFDIAGKLNDIPALMKDMEKKINAPKITEVAVSDGGILIKGENISQQAHMIQIDPSRSWVNLHSKIQSGVDNVELSPEMKNIDGNLLALLKKAIKDNLASIPGLDVDREAIMKHIGSEELKKLKKETIDKKKPTIIVWGSASMEGGFATNRRIAKARAESTKQKLEKKGYKVKAKWAIQGLGKRIDSVSSYKEQEQKMLEEWNENISPKNKLKNIKELYAKLKNIDSCTQKEKEFLNKYFVAGRRVAMQVEYPKDSTTQIAMKFENADNAAA